MWTSKLDSIRHNLLVLLNTLPIFWRAAPLYLSLLLVLLPIEGLLPAFNIWLVKLIVDSLVSSVTGVEGYSLLWLVGLWALAVTVSALISPWIALIQGNLNEKLTEHVNLLLIDKTNSFKGISLFEDSTFYDDLQVLQNEARYRPLNTLVAFINLLRSLITLGALLAIVATLTWWIPLVIVLSSLSGLRVTTNIYKIAWEAVVGSSTEARRMNYSRSVVMSEAYAKEVRLFRIGHFFADSYKAAFAKLHSVTSRSRLRQAYGSIPAVLFSAAGNIYAFWWVVTNAVQRSTTAGDIVLLVQSLGQTQDALAGVTHYAGLLRGHLLFFDKLHEFLRTESDITLESAPVSLSTTTPPEIAFDNVSFEYPDGRTALSNVSFKIDAGERVALVGENGAGKTTIVKLLLRLYDPTKGSITVNGIDLKQLDLDAWRKQVGVVFQDYGKYQLTASQNVGIGDIERLQDDEKIKEATRRAGAHAFIEDLPGSYETQLGKQFDGTELSGGQWQRLAIARAFVSEAKMMVLDEPTASLDPRSEYDLYQDFAVLSRTNTVLLITHRLASVAMVNRIIVLQKGVITEQGTHSALIEQSGEYSNLYRMQADAYKQS